MDFLERYLELEDLLGINNRVSFIPKSYKIKEIGEVEHATRTFVNAGNWEKTPYPISSKCWKKTISRFICSMLINPFPGCRLFKGNIGVIVLNQNKEIPLVRRRFSALHELAHLYLDLSGFDEKEAEQVCDRFAAAMLLPASKIKEALGANRTKIVMKELFIIAGQYGISLSAIAYRAFSLGIISASYHKFFMINYNKFKTKEKEFDVYTGKENSDRFLQLLIRAVAEEVISTTKAAALNNQKLGDFREILDNAVK